MGLGSRAFPNENPRAVYANRARLKSGVGRAAMRKRGELVERSFAHVLDRGGMRRVYLRGLENLRKRYTIHVAGFNLGVLMRALFGQGTPKEASLAATGVLIVVQTNLGAACIVIAVILAVIDDQPKILLIAIAQSRNRTPG